MNYKKLIEVKCGCGSDKSIFKCCNFNNYKSEKTSFLPPGSKTNFSLTKCYMNVTQNCSNNISKEHMVSEGVLKLVGNNLDVTGFPWLKNQSKRLPTTVLASNILCKRHNNAFSTLDEIGKDFVQTIKQFSKKDDSTNELKVFNGVNVEQWMLKTFYGFLHSSNFQAQKDKKIEAEIDQKCVNLLNGKLPHLNKRGFFIRSDSNHTINSVNSIAVSPITNSQKLNIQGMTMNILGFDFLLSTCPMNVENSIYRPNFIVFNNSNIYKIIKLIWPLDNQNAIVEFISP